LEHDANWCSKVARQLGRSSLPEQVLLSPLMDYGTFDWYREPPDDVTGTGFALELCDGPPAETRGGRDGLVRVMLRHILPGSTILLDGVDRDKERATALRWAGGLNAVLRIVDDQVAVLQVSR